MEKGCSCKIEQRLAFQKGGVATRWNKTTDICSKGEVGAFLSPSSLFSAAPCSQPVPIRRPALAWPTAFLFSPSADSLGLEGRATSQRTCKTGGVSHVALADILGRICTQPSFLFRACAQGEAWCSLFTPESKHLGTPLGIYQIHK